MGLFENLISTNPEKFHQCGTSSNKIDANVYSANRLCPEEKDPAINRFLKLLKETSPEDSITLIEIHLNLMKIYYKHSNTEKSYILKSSYHAKEAFIKGDLSGMAAYRLTVNLTKEKKFHQAIEVCELIADPDFQFSPHGQKKKPEFDFMLKKLKRKVKTEKVSEEILFNDEEVKMIMVNSKKQY